MGRYQKGKTDLDFTEARDSEWQWHQLGHMQVCILLQTDNHASTSPLSFLQAGCPSCHPTNSVKALKVLITYTLVLAISNTATAHHNSTNLNFHVGCTKVGKNTQSITQSSSTERQMGLCTTL